MLGRFEMGKYNTNTKTELLAVVPTIATAPALIL